LFEPLIDRRSMREPFDNDNLQERQRGMQCLVRTYNWCHKCPNHEVLSVQGSNPSNASYVFKNKAATSLLSQPPAVPYTFTSRRE